MKDVIDIDNEIEIDNDIHQIYQFKNHNIDTVDTFDTILNRKKLEKHKTTEHILNDMEKNMMTGNNPFKKQPIKHHIEQPIKQPIKQQCKKVSIMDM